jgi:hypothetical protein
MGPRGVPRDYEFNVYLPAVIVVVLMVFLDVKSRGKLVENVGFTQSGTMSTEENLAIVSLNHSGDADFIVVYEFHSLDVDAKVFVGVDYNGDSPMVFD